MGHWTEQENQNKDTNGNYRMAHNTGAGEIVYSCNHLEDGSSEQTRKTNGKNAGGQQFRHPGGQT